MHKVLVMAILLCLAAAARAEEDEAARMEIGGDVFHAAQEATHDAGPAEDLFLAGETVRASAPVSGTAHVAGRWITLDTEIGGDLYGAGMELAVRARVGGDATVLGRELTLSAVGGDLRATGSQVTLGGPVSGYALLSAERLTIDGTVAGDAHVTAREVSFGPEATIGGRLVLYEAEPGTLTVPARVVPAERVERREMGAWGEGITEYRGIGWSDVILRFVAGIVVVAGLAALAAAVMPQTLAGMRRRLLEQPLRAVWFGFLAQSAVIGAAVLLAVTVIGILLSPAAVVLAGLAAFAGYVVGVYAFGVAIMHAAGRPFPADWLGRAVAAALGAVVAALLGLVPFLGWLFVLALTLAGIGAAVMYLLRPRFFV